MFILPQTPTTDWQPADWHASAVHTGGDIQALEISDKNTHGNSRLDIFKARGAQRITPRPGRFALSGAGSHPQAQASTSAGLHSIPPRGPGMLLACINISGFLLVCVFAVFRAVWFLVIHHKLSPVSTSSGRPHAATDSGCHPGDDAQELTELHRGREPQRCSGWMGVVAVSR